ncbi:MAG: undecaprenyldiphospho-muramoylpentapeptide beta-N-acetylglucosaminyltransferase [Bacteroidales bacterium]
MKVKRYMNQSRHNKVIISGGGTGGHIFPAISIANALRRLDKDIEILFVGAEGRMEMDKVPAAGYKIIGLPVAGFNRKQPWKNIPVLFKLLRSLLKAIGIIRDFRPDVVVGVGGYASGPVLKQAGRSGIPTLLQEQNSYAGVTNRLLARGAAKICVAYDGMEKYFPAQKIVKTGNPVRQSFDNLESIRAEACSHFGLEQGKPVVLVLGGSLGAGSINNSLAGSIEVLKGSGYQWLWQTGKNYLAGVNAVVTASASPNIHVHGFIDRMDFAFAAADVIISRAGAGTISELCLVGKPVILVPSPNVAEDHQTRNAMALVSKGAALMVADSQSAASLVSTAINLVSDSELREKLSANISLLAERDSDIRIAREVLSLVKE